MKEKTIIVFSPHPDDETFGCGGTIARRLSEGHEVLVVIMTDGRHSYSNRWGIYTNPTPEELMKTRKGEVKRSMKLLGLRKENLIFLNFEDGTLGQDGEKVEEEVTRILARHPPAEVYCVYENDCHPDHRAASRIVKNSIKKANLDITQFEYLISHRYGRLGRLMDILLSLIRRKTFQVDVADFLPIKEEAIKEFKSQVSTMSEAQETPVIKNFSRFMRKKEIFFISKSEKITDKH